MATNIDILTSGYATLDETITNGGQKFMRANGSCCLVRSNKTNILFDTMGPWERNLLIDRLSELKIHPEDIEYLVCSHSHPDHIGNLNLFTSAKKHFVGTSVYTADVYDLNQFEPIGNRSFKTPRGCQIEYILYKSYDIDTHLRIDPTPGHTMECISMIVTNCDKYGHIGLVGDLFERQEDLDDESIWLGAGSQNPDNQRAHRSRIYNQVSYILPGHGPIFRKVDGKL